MAKKTMKEKARRKMLSILGRNDLEDLSNMPRPWHADRPTLIESTLANWNQYEIEYRIKSLLKSCDD